MTHYSNDNQDEYNGETSLMSESGQDLVERWDWQ